MRRFWEAWRHGDYVPVGRKTVRHCNSRFVALRRTEEQGAVFAKELCYQLFCMVNEWCYSLAILLIQAHTFPLYHFK